MGLLFRSQDFSSSSSSFSFLLKDIGSLCAIEHLVHIFNELRLNEALSSSSSLMLISRISVSEVGKQRCISVVSIVAGTR